MFFIALFGYGLVNNNGYVMIAAGADTLADDFGKGRLMPAFQICLVVFSSLSRLVHAQWFLRT